MALDTRHERNIAQPAHGALLRDVTGRSKRWLGIRLSGAKPLLGISKMLYEHM
jgi:hypothetical protein